MTKINKTVSYDIIIVTNANLRLKRGSIKVALESIRRQTFQPNSIILVNNGCDDTNENSWIQSTICDFYNVQYIEIKTPNRSAARNAGINQSKSDYIVFMDDDILLPSKAMELSISKISENHFCCGAHRRYLPMEISINRLKLLVEKEEWQIIDNLANDQQVMDSGFRQRFRHFPHQSTFVSCFGIVPRKTALEILYDENYTGWGLEDTDYMRRLLHKIGFRSIDVVTVYHIDHLVSPYIWRDHWGKNFQLYLKGINEYGYLRIFNLFQSAECPPKSHNVLLFFQDTTNNYYIPQISRKYKSIIESLLTEYKKDLNIAAIILTGSNLYSKNPKDIDIVKVVFSGDSGFNIVNKDGITVEEQTISIPSLEATLFHPEWLPDTWLWVASRYVNSQYLWMRIDVKTIATENVRATLNRRLCHLLTLHLGALIRCARADSNYDRIEGIKHAASILFLSNQSFPDRMKFPFTNLSSIVEKIKKYQAIMLNPNNSPERILCDELSDYVINIIKNNHLEKTEQRVYLPDCYIGLEIIKREKWGCINATWEKIFR